MPKESTILISLHRLRRNIRAGEVPRLDELPDLAADWATLLLDLDDEAMAEAVTGYLRGDCPFWPTPGQLLALAPKRRIAAVDDSAAAWTETKTWIRNHSRNKDTLGYNDPGVGQLDPNDAQRDTAMRAGLAAVGGAKAHMMGQTADDVWRAKRFAEGYLSARQRGHVAIEERVAKRIAGPAGTEQRTLPPMLRAVLGPDPDEHANQRKGAHDLERGR